MSLDLRYNQDFTDADEKRLVYVAPLANQAKNRYHTCGWVTGQQICSELVQCRDFTDHLRTYHGIVGPDKAQLRCCWVNCFAEMRKESLTRHVQERHLEVRYQCPNCPEQFTRTHTLHSHMLKKHGS